jgi:hypothetical protein
MMTNVVQSMEWELAGKTAVLGENLPSATLSTTNPTWPDPGSNPGRCGGKPATNRLSYGTARNKVCPFVATVHHKAFGARRYPPVSTAEDKNGWSHEPTSNAPYGFMAWYLVKHRDAFDWIEYSNWTVDGRATPNWNLTWRSEFSGRRHSLPAYLSAQSCSSVCTQAAPVVSYSAA